MTALFCLALKFEARPSWRTSDDRQCPPRNQDRARQPRVPRARATIFHQPFGMDQGLNRGLNVPGSFWASMLSMSVMGFPAVDTLASAVRGGGHEGKGGGGGSKTGDDALS